MSDNTIQRWGEKPYYSLDFYLKETFGQKIYKLALDAGMTCPNRDGTLDTRGCIFCSKGGSGDFATKQAHSVTQQIDDAITFLQTHDKKTGQKYIAYFQSYSNTYAPVKKLRSRSDADIRYPVLNKLSKNCKKETFLLLYISSLVFPAKAQKRS